MNRRDFLSSVAAIGALTAAKTFSFAANPSTQPAAAKPLRVGVITDLHHLAWNVDEVPRLTAFIDAAINTKADFIIQCGDFTYPAGCPAIMPVWNRFEGPKYHVLGNHDMDKCDKPTIMKLWDMPKNYYSFDQAGFHFVVLDRNFFRLPNETKTQDYAHGNWGKAGGKGVSFINDDQLKWLADDLEKTDKPTVVWVHQPVVATDATDNANARDIVAAFDLANFKAKQKTGSPRVIAAFMGHDHNDQYAQRNGVHYILLNSASYAYTEPEGPSYYQDPLFSFITFDPAGKITIEGRTTNYGPKPAADRVQMLIPAKISDRTLKTV